MKVLFAKFVTFTTATFTVIFQTLFQQAFFAVPLFLDFFTIMLRELKMVKEIVKSTYVEVVFLTL